MTPPTFDIIIRFVPRQGYLGILTAGGVEYYTTGGFHHVPEAAMDACLNYAIELWGEP